MRARRKSIGPRVRRSKLDLRSLAKINVPLLSYVCLATLGEELNFIRAARRLRIPPSELKKFIVPLERSYKVKVMEPDGQNVKLTEAGAVMLPTAKRIREDLRKFSQAVVRVDRKARSPAFAPLLE